MRRTKLALAAVITMVMVAGLVAPASAASKQERTLMRYAVDTWRSFEAMVEPSTGLVADNIEGDLDPSTRSAFTSPTNIGGYSGAPLSRVICASSASARPTSG